MNYTEKDLRKAFRAGMNKGGHQSYFDAPLDEDEYIESLNLKQTEEETIPMTYGVLKRIIDWDDLYTIIGVCYYASNEGFVIDDTEVFNIEVSVAKKYNLI